jgi:hypothetical protein
LSGGKFTPAGKGTVILSAVIAGGLPDGDYTEEGIAIRIGDALIYKKSAAAETIAGGAYEDFDGAMAFINDTAAAHEQYVVLVGADQEIAPYRSPEEAGKAGVEITLRGYGGERKIRWDGSSKSAVSGYGQGLFTLDNGAALILDKDITLDGEGTGLQVGTQDTACSMIYMGNAHLRMKQGAKITGFSGSAAAAPVNTRAGPTISGSITLEGGEISGNSPGGGYYYDVYIQAEGEAPAGYTFTMSGGAIKDNGGRGGVYLADGVRGTMSGGEISGYRGTNGGYGIHCLTGSFTMEGGKVGNNKIGVYFAKSDGLFTMTGGEISNNGAEGSPLGGGIRITEDSGSLFLDGPVTFTNNTISLENYNTNGIVYLGSGFSSTEIITLTLASPDNFFMEDWGVERTVIMGGTPAAPEGITDAQKAKISVNAAIGDDDNAMVEKTGGSVSLTWSGDPVVGVVKWTAD